MTDKLYQGTYTYEGHDVAFYIDENGGTVVISESFNGAPTSRSTDVTEALQYQNNLVKLGYTSY